MAFVPVSCPRQHTRNDPADGQRHSIKYIQIILIIIVKSIKRPKLYMEKEPSRIQKITPLPCPDSGIACPSRLIFPAPDDRHRTDRLVGLDLRVGLKSLSATTDNQGQDLRIRVNVLPTDWIKRLRSQG